MNVRPERARTVQNLCRDTEMSTGMTAVMLVLNRKHGWGAKRLSRLIDEVNDFTEKEIMPKSQRFTQTYLSEIQYAFQRMSEALDQIVNKRKGA